jgi:hypothetical protein
MRVPTVRFFGDERPIEPWEERVAPFVMPFVIPLLFGAVLFVSAIGVLSLLAWGVASPLLPKSWRLDWDTAFDLDPSYWPECPACEARMKLGAVHKRGHAHKTDLGQEYLMPTQTAECQACSRSFQRLSLGKVWSPWGECQNAEPIDGLPSPRGTADEGRPGGVG